MWYFMFAVSIYTCVYTLSYGVFEWKKGNKGAACAVCVLSALTPVIPIIKIFI